MSKTPEPKESSASAASQRGDGPEGARETGVKPEGARETGVKPESPRSFATFAELLTPSEQSVAEPETSEVCANCDSDTVTRLRQQIKDLTGELEEVRYEHLNQLEDQRLDSQKAITEVQRDFDSRLDSVDAQHHESLLTLETSHNNAISALVQSYETELAKQDERNQAKFERHIERSKKLQDQLELRVENTREDHSKQVAGLKEELERLEATRSELLDNNIKLKETIDQVESKVRQLAKHNDELVKKLNLQRSNSDIEVGILQSTIDDLRTQLQGRTRLNSQARQRHATEIEGVLKETAQVVETAIANAAQSASGAESTKPAQSVQSIDAVSDEPVSNERDKDTSSAQDRKLNEILAKSHQQSMESARYLREVLAKVDEMNRVNKNLEDELAVANDRLLVATAREVQLERDLSHVRLAVTQEPQRDSDIG